MQEEENLGYNLEVIKYVMKNYFGKENPKYSFHSRNNYIGQHFNSPGPGCYESSNLSKNGKYFSSKTRNISTSAWSKSKSPRFTKIRFLLYGILVLKWKMF